MGTVAAADEGARGMLEAVVASGGVVLFPADGLYGLGCDPLNEAAVRRIHSIKGRDEGKPSAVMYFSPLAMRELVRDMGEGVRTTVGKLMPGPVTLIVPNPAHRYPLACREDPERLGVRLIGGPLAGATCPIFQTSANVSGEPAPGSFEEVSEQIRSGVDLAIDGGRLTGEPSTVIDLTAFDREGVWRILREGAMPADEVAERLGALSSED